MTIEKYIADLFGVKDTDIGNLHFSSEVASGWHLGNDCNPLFISGMITTKLRFNCIVRLKDVTLYYKVGSLVVFSEEYKSFEDHTYLWQYEVICLKGKETNEVVKLIGDRYLC